MTGKSLIVNDFRWFFGKKERASSWRWKQGFSRKKAAKTAYFKAMQRLTRRAARARSKLDEGS
jgi:hypothetical protein